MLLVCFVIQAATISVLVFGDIGFDLRGRFGLSFEHGVLCALIYLAALIFGLVLTLKRRRWALAATQAMVPVLLLASAFVPAPKVTVTDYQHLVGQPRQVVERELGSRGAVYGMASDDRG